MSRRTLMKFGLGGGVLLGLAACSAGPAAGQGDTSGAASSNGTSDGSPAATSGGVSSATESSDTAAAGNKGGTIAAGWGLNKFPSLEPALLSSAEGLALAVNIYEGLTRLTENVDIEPCLATEWTVSEDGLRYTFTLREGVQWHNGDTLTAQDFVDQYERVSDPDTGSPHKSAISAISSVTAPDDKTVVIELDSPDPGLLVTLTGSPGRAMAPLNKKAFDEMGADRYGLTPPGTGPFKVAEHKSGQYLTLERFDHYWDSQYPHVDTVKVTLIPEVSTLRSALLAGDVQFINAVPPESYDAIAANKKINAVRGAGLNWHGIWINVKSESAPFLADHNVRLAIAKAINREELIEKGLFGNGVVSRGPISPAIEWAYNENVSRSQDFDLDGAKKLIADAGLEGVKLEFMSRPQTKRIDEIIVHLLNNAGLNVVLDLVEDSVYHQRLETAGGSAYQLTHARTSVKPDPDGALYPYFGSEGAYNRSGLADPAVDELLEKQRAALDRDERRQLLWETEERIVENCNMAFLYHQDDLVAMSSEVEGYLHVDGLRSFRTVSV